MKDTIICSECGRKHEIEYPNSIVWDEGEIECTCGKIIKFKNERLENLFI